MAWWGDGGGMKGGGGGGGMKRSWDEGMGGMMGGQMQKQQRMGGGMGMGMGGCGGGGCGGGGGGNERQMLQMRIQQAEQQLRMQEQQISMMNTRLDQMEQMSSGGGGHGERNQKRNDGPKPPIPTPPPGVPLMSTEEFASMNSLDAKCMEVLMNQVPEVQQYVVGLGPCEGRNPSAMVLSRVRKATTEFSLFSKSRGGAPVAEMGGPDGVRERVEEFISSHTLDDKCSQSLRAQSIDCQAAVVALGPAEGRSPPAMIMARVAKYNRQAL